MDPRQVRNKFYFSVDVVVLSLSRLLLEKKYKANFVVFSSVN